MNEELIKRIDAYIDCENVSDRESETQLLEDCRAALTKKYVPMANDELQDVWIKSAYLDGTETMRMMESAVVHRAGLEVQE